MTPATARVAAPVRRARTYDEVAPVYDRWKWQEFWRRNEAPVVRELLAREPLVSRALDVGAGTGALCPLLAERARSVTALDASDAMLRELRARDTATATVLGDAAALPFADGTFQRVGAARLLSHLATLAAFFGEAGRVTVPGAAVVVTDLHPAFEYQHSTFGVAACSAPFSPTRHPLPVVAGAATAAGFAVECLRAFARDDLVWRPPPGEYLTLDANDGAVFYVALLRRR